MCPRRTGERARTHRGTAGVGPRSLRVCASVQSAPGVYRVCGQPLSVSLAPSGGLTPRVCRRPSQGGVPELGGQPAAGGPLGLPARRQGRRPGLPGGQDLGPVPPLLAESPSPVQELPQGHALVLRQPQLVDDLGEERRKRCIGHCARVRPAGQRLTPALCWLGRGFEHPQESFPVRLSWEMASYGEADF